MTSLDHAHFRFTFYGRLHFFRFSPITPWPLTIFPKFLRGLVGVGGPQKFGGINLDICPRRGARPPGPKFRDRNFFQPSFFRLTSCIDRGRAPLHACKICSKVIDRFSRKWGLKVLGWGVFWGSPASGGAIPHLTIACCSPWDPEKNKPGSGGIAPHLWEIWGFKCLYFGLHLLQSQWMNIPSRVASSIWGRRRPNLHTTWTPRTPTGWWRHLATPTSGFDFWIVYIFFVFHDLCTGEWRYFWNFYANLWRSGVPKSYDVETRTFASRWGATPPRPKFHISGSCKISSLAFFDLPP